MSKYEVGDKRFRFICDASEWSWQLCRAFIDQLEDPERYVIREFDDHSYCVLAKNTNQLAHTAKVKLLI